ncbi:universal stress protein [Klenkia sp. PcliD-1-E]|uniref:universal stress protein n=1 Tax=Klenkia sp. PcliD-1-E TaxID=2954492 RepID=UPI00209692B5|nr:universal stress protein [Klenkia sp. PcliD-1-E]MCO7222021.1 universal stress protein [Klenkia sp. PcliD-1-E]
MDIAGGSSAEFEGWVICGVSGSASSRAALRWALREAQDRDAPLMAVRVWPGGGARTRARAERDLVELVVGAVRATGVHGRTWVRLVEGDPRAVLAALGDSADLLVLGSHRPGALTG